MRFLLESRGAGAATPVEAARAAHAAGLDGVLLGAGEELPAPLLAAAHVAAAVPDLLVAAEVGLGDRHPLEVAEEAVTVDQVAAGRLVLVARPADGHRDRYEEALDLLLTATAARPFRFEGEHWRVPARLPENSDAHDSTVRLTPTPVRPRLELWCAGVPAQLAAERGLGHLAEPGDGPRGARPARGVAAVAPRARRAELGDASALLAELRAGRERDDQDWSVVVAPAAAAAEIGGFVRPRIQLERLPEGLERHWRDG